MEIDVNELVALHEKGLITEDRLVVECLLRIDPSEPAKVLQNLSPDLIARTLWFSHQFQPDASLLSSSESLPSMDQVFAARKWIERQAIDTNSSSQDGRDCRHAEPLDPGRFTEVELLEMEQAGITLGDAIEQIERLHG